MTPLEIRTAAINTKAAILSGQVLGRDGLAQVCDIVADLAARLGEWEESAFVAQRQVEHMKGKKR